MQIKQIVAVILAAAALGVGYMVYRAVSVDTTLTDITKYEIYGAFAVLTIIGVGCAFNYHPLMWANKL